MLLLFQCLMKEESEKIELAFVRYIDCLPPLHKRDEALRCVPAESSQDSAKRDEYCRKEKIDRDYAAAGERYESIPSQININAIHPV